MVKHRPYSFLTSDSFRIEVQAANARSAFSKVKRIGKEKGKVMTRVYTTYGRNGTDTGWRGLAERKPRDPLARVKKVFKA